MELLISATMAILPSIFLLRYFYKKDSARPEPKVLILKIFFIGILSIIPALILEVILIYFENQFVFNKFIKIFFRSFIVAALCEEYIKLQVVKRFVYNNKHFDEIMDGIIYTIVASMGFALFENILYVIDGGLLTATIRAFTALPLHAFSSGIMGYYIGKAKFAKNKDDEKYLFTKGLLIAIFIHGIYDFAIFSISIFGIISIIAVVILIPLSYFVLMKKIKSALYEDTEYFKKNSFFKDQESP